MKHKNRNPFTYIYIIWALMFIIMPLVMLFGHSIITQDNGAIQFTLKHFARVFDPLYISVIMRSIKIAAISTLICLVLGYPLAMILAKYGKGKGSLLIILMIIPMWMNFLARTYAWMSLLDSTGIVNSMLRAWGLPAISIMYTEAAVVLGTVYNFLPFMVLPIYTAILKIDRCLIEAAEDLGATPLTVFGKVILPLSVSGIVTGITMVFLPAVSTFAISRLLGGGKVNMVGNLIETQFLTSNDWGFGSALSVVVMIMILVSIFVLNKYTDGDEGRGLF